MKKCQGPHMFLALRNTLWPCWYRNRSVWAKQTLLWQQHWRQVQGSRRTTAAWDRASSGWWVTVSQEPWGHRCLDQEVPPCVRKVTHFSLPVPLHWNQHSRPVMHKMAERHSFTTATGRREPRYRKVQGKAIHLSIILSNWDVKLKTNTKQWGRWHV